MKDKTLAKLCEELDIPLYKGMELGRYFKEYFLSLLDEKEIYQELLSITNAEHPEFNDTLWIMVEEHRISRRAFCKLLAKAILPTIKNKLEGEE